MIPRFLSLYYVRIYLIFPSVYVFIKFYLSLQVEFNINVLFTSAFHRPIIEILIASVLVYVVIFLKAYSPSKTTLFFFVLLFTDIFCVYLQKKVIVLNSHLISVYISYVHFSSTDRV